METHVHTVDNEDRPYPCDVCSKEYKTKGFFFKKEKNKRLRDKKNKMLFFLLFAFLCYEDTYELSIKIDFFLLKLY